MKIPEAQTLIDILTGAIKDAQAEGRDEIDLGDALRAADDDARDELVRAIREAGGAA